MRFWRHVLSMAVVCLLSNPAMGLAQCACKAYWPEACDAVCTRTMLSFHWEDIPGTVITDYSITTAAVAELAIGGCPHAGAVPQETTCAAIGKTATTKAFQVNGSIGPDGWGLVGNYDLEKKVSANCSGSQVTLRSWCSCCRTRAGLKYKNTSKQQRCRPPQGWPGPQSGLPQSCDNVLFGSLKEYMHVVCDELPCKPPSPCDPICPSGGSE